MAVCSTDLTDSNMPRSTSSRLIPSYNLFGESTDLPDVIHCETIAARSMLHDWELAPHRHARLHQVLLLHAGSGHAQLDGSLLALTPGTLVNVPTGRVHAFNFTPDTEGWVVTLASDTLDELLAQAADLRRRITCAQVVPAPAGLDRRMAELAAEFNARHYARAQVLRGMAATLLGLVARALRAASPDNAGAPAAGNNPGTPANRSAAATAQHLLAQFEALLEEHHAQRWGVADYARAMAVSSTHLSRVVRQACGVPASRLIEDRLIREARRNLQYTRLQVASIAYLLGFSDPALFSRVFQRATGVSPRAFRQAFAERAQA
jgi:AraC family transcriptional regulator, transcriptional activator of pobA